jgi:hypothetical protein
LKASGALLLTFLLAMNTMAQVSSLNTSSTGFIPGKFRMFEVDVLGNIYAITQNEQLRKFSEKGDSLGIWNDVRQYGKPTSVDVSNPMRILVFFQPFSTVVVLDRLLTFRHALNLRKSNVFSAGCVANSYDNHIWVFDELEFKLKKLNDEGQILFESADWRLLFDDAPTPRKMADHRNELFFFDQIKGLFVFDYYGSFKKALPDFNYENPGISQTSLYGFKTDSLFLYEPGKEMTQTVRLSREMNWNAPKKIGNGKLYVLEGDGIRIFQLTNQR